MHALPIPGPGRERFAVWVVRPMICAAAAGMLVLWAAASVPADTITTRTGETFTGTIVEETPGYVVLKSILGKRKFPRSVIKTVEKSADSAPAETTPEEKPKAKITPIEVAPEEADERFQEARSALVAGQWVKAGGLLEGLMQLDEEAFGTKKRLGATGALITCYLQIRDPHGAARAIAKRAGLAKDENNRKCLLAAAEMLRELGTVKVDGKVLSRFEQVVEAAMPWKAEQVLAEAKATAREAKRLNDMAHLAKAADLALEQLREANIYVPAFSESHRTEVLKGLVENILNAARSAVEHCKKVRPELTKRRLSSIVSKAAAAQWNSVARVYLAQRQAAEQALKNLKPFSLRYKVPALHERNEAEVEQLLADLDEYQYYPRGTYFGPYSSYGYSSYRRERVKIQLRTYGGR